MEMDELLAQDAVVPNLKAGSKKQLLQELSHKAATLTGLEERRAGWLAFALLLTLFASMWARMSLLDGAQRPMYAGLLLLIMLNNLTVPAVGGRLTVVFLFLMALAHIPVQQKVMEA